MANRARIMASVLLLGFLWAASTVSAAPMAGRITGTVLDATNGDPLPGANVAIQGTSKGAATDLEGNYVISGVPAGEYTLVVSYVGYEQQTRQVQVSDGEAVEADFELAWAGVEGEEVVVTAQAQGQISAINQQLTSNTITNVVSAARIQELPDVNAAESIGRLPGVSIQRSGGEANKIAIRGLSPKFNNVTINGVRVPATDSDNRSVDLSLISSNSLDGIEVKKAITPDMDADAIGGSVDLRLKTAPEGLIVDLAAQGGYTALQEYYGNYKFTGTASNRFLDGRLGAIVNFNVDNFDRSANKLEGVWRRDNRVPDEIRLEIQNLRLRDENLKRSRLGGSVLLDFQLPQGKITANTFYQELSNEGMNRVTDYTLVGNQNILWRLEENEGTTSLFTGALNIEQDLGRLRYDAGVARTGSYTENPENRAWEFIQEANVQNPDTSQIGWKVPIEDAQLFVQEIIAQQADNPQFPYAGLSTIMVDQIDREENVTMAHLNLQTPFRFGNNISGYVKTGGKLRWLDRSNDEEQIGRGGLQYGNNAQSLNPPLRCMDAHLPDIDLFEMVGTQGIPFAVLLDSSYSQPNFLDHYTFSYAGNPELLNRLTDALQQCDEEPEWHYRDQPIGSFGRDYSGIERYQAGYVMAEFSLGRYITLIPGVRWERDYSRYNGQRYREVVSGYEPLPPQDFDSLETTRENEFWLPMVHLQVKPTDWLTLRLARTETLSRPDYRQYAPITTIDQFNSSIVATNSSLRPSHATNYDAAVSVYQGKIGLFTVAGFYKSIDDLITSVSYSVSSRFTDQLDGTNIPPAWYQDYTPTVYTNINNPFDTHIKGVEFDWQTNFWYLPSFLKGLVLSANYTYIQSETTYQNFRTVAGDSLITPRPPTYNQVLADTTRVGRVPDQPSHIANVMIGYDVGGFSTRLSFLYQTDVAANISARNPIEDTFSDDYFRVDVTVRQKLGGMLQGLELFANFNNLTSVPDLNYQANTGRQTFEENYGFTMDIGGRYRF